MTNTISHVSVSEEIPKSKCRFFANDRRRGVRRAGQRLPSRAVSRAVFDGRSFAAVRRLSSIEAAVDGGGGSQIRICASGRAIEVALWFRLRSAASRVFFLMNLFYRTGLAGMTAVVGLWVAVAGVSCTPRPAVVPPPRVLPLIIAHRGASGHAPENTLAAFKLAWEQEADGIEGDFHLTKDGHIICLHDADTKRTSAGGVLKNVRESTLAELRALDVGLWKGEAFRGETIPTLEEVMAVVPSGKAFFLEVKCGPEIVPALLAALEAGPLTREQVTVISFNDNMIRSFKAEAPDWRASWLVSVEPDAGGAPQPSIFALLDTLSRLSAEGVGLQADQSLDARYFDELRAVGFERHVWTVNSPVAARRFVAFGVDSITTDVPGALREALRTGQD